MMPEGEFVYTYQAKHKCLCNMLHFLTLQNLPKTYQCYLSFFIVMGTRCDCVSIVCHCYDVLSYHFIVMMFMRIMVVIVVLLIYKAKNLYWAENCFIMMK